MALMNFRTEGSSSTTSEMCPMPLWTASRYEMVPQDCRFGAYSKEPYQPIEHPRA
jgi:hypothetical protein